jgi:flagellin
VIDKFDLPNQNRTTLNAAKAVAIGGIVHATDVITSTAHGFSNGDVVAGTLASNEAMTGLIAGKHYVVTDVTADTFKLATFDANGTATAVNFATSNNTVAASFRKVEKALNVQTLDRDENLKGTPVTIMDKELGNDQNPPPLNSVRLTGQVMFESPNVFTITPKDDESLFRDDPESASLRKISDMDVLSVRNAQRMMSAVDGALRKVDAERGDLGATMNRMEHTIDNLSNIVVNTTVSRGRIEDADMAEESVNLSKSQVLQQAATAMLAQANQSMQSVLDLLR